MTDTNKNIFNLDELSGYKVVENYSDVRGWNAKDANNRPYKFSSPLQGR